MVDLHAGSRCSNRLQNFAALGQQFVTAAPFSGVTGFPRHPAGLFSMHPLDAAKCVESTGGDLERAAVRKEQMDQASWKAARNLQLRQSAAKEQNLVNKASRTRKR